MTTILTRAAKGSPLTNAENDANFINLNAGKIEITLLAVALGIATLDGSGKLLAAQVPTNINAATVTTNANLTGPITSSGNATAIASQTGTGATFAMSVGPTFTGVPAAPTAAADTNTTQLATTAFYVGQASSTNPLMDGSVAVGSSLRFARADHVHASDTSRAPTANPTFTGTVTVSILAASGQITSSLASGTAPMVITSTTQVANLNASLLVGGNWASPGWLGQVTPNAGTFTSLVATSATVSGDLRADGRLSAMGAFAVTTTAINMQPSSGSPTPLTGVTQYGMYMNMEATASATTAAFGYVSRMATMASAYTLPAGVGFAAFDGALGAGSTYTQQEGFRASDLTVATTNIGFRSMLSAGATKWNIFAEGTAKNYFAGNVGIGLSQPVYPLEVKVNTSAQGIRLNGRTSDNIGHIAFSNNSGATEYCRVQSNADNKISFYCGSAADKQVEIGYQSSAVNYVTLIGGKTGNVVRVGAGGPDANIGLNLSSVGTGNISFVTDTTANLQFRVRGDNVAINWFDVFGTTTGNGPILRAEGFDSNIDINLYSKGTGSVILATNQGAQKVLQVSHVASAVNYLNVIGAVTGGFPEIQAAGSDTNIGLIVRAKGTGGVIFYAGNAVQCIVGAQASAVNYILLSGATTGNKPFFLMSGSDTNISCMIASKGTGTIALQTNASITQLEVLHTASATRWLTATGSNGGNPTISATGGAIAIAVGLVEALVSLTYSASISLTATLANAFLINATNGTAFTINAPTSPSTGQRIEITIKNTSGGALGVATWNAVFKMVAWTQPANGFSRAIEFRYDGTNWVEKYRSAADVAN